MKRSSRRRGLRLTAAILGGLLILYTLAGFLLVPALARREFNAYVSRLPGVQLRLDAIRFNPFTLEARLQGLALQGPEHAPLAGFQLLDVAISPSSLWQPGYALRRIELTAPTLDVSIGPDGRLNLRVLTPPAAPGAAGASAATRTSTPPLRVDVLRISGGRAQYEDRSRALPFVTTLAPIDFALRDFTTRAGGNGTYQLRAQASSGESLQLQGSVSLQPLASSGQFSLQALQASTVKAYLGDALPVDLRSGKAAVTGSYRFSGAGQDSLAVQLDELRLDDVALADRQGDAPPWLSIPQLSLRGVSIALPERRIQIASLSVQQPKLSLWVEPDGSLSVAQLLAASGPTTAAVPAPAGGTAAPAAVPAPPAAAGAAASASGAGPGGPSNWSVSLARLTLDAAHLSLADRSVTPAVAIEVGPLQLTALDYSTAQERPLRFELSTGIGRGGRLASHGALTLVPLSGTVSLDLQHFDLSVLQPYIDRRAPVHLYRGTLGVQGSVALSAPHAGAGGGKQPHLLATGEVDLENFATRDRLTEMDLLDGRAVRLMDIRFQQQPDALQIGSVRAQGLFGRVVIASDGTLNLTALLHPAGANGTGGAGAAAPGATQGRAGQAGAGGEGSVAAVAPAPAPASASGPTMPIRIDRVQLSGATANFTDRSVQPNFSAAIEGLHGTIVGLSSDPGSRARVQLTGAVNRYAPVSIDGQINVLSAQTFTDLAMSFQNIDLPLFNPYSGKFAGYSIAQGKLSTQMHYHVEQGRLNATHHIVIDQLEFGPATASKQAVPLPIKLAAALLKDRHGVITLDLPVGGSLSDPTFRIGPIVWKLFVGLIRHIVTAPFSWLGSLLGGDGARLAYVDFAPGSSTLDADSQHKLTQLAQALAQRPQLRLDIPLHTESQSDDRAIEHLGLDAALAGILAAPAGAQGTAAAGADSGRAPHGRRRGAGRAAVPAQPPTRLAALSMLYVRQFQSAPQYPADAVSDEQRMDWLEQQLLPRFGPHRQQRDALGLARATAAQMAVLAGGQVAPTRVFFTQRASGGASTGVVRMELQLQ